MRPRFRIGLITGVVGLLINIPISMFFGICGPGVSLIAGALAGFFTAQAESAVDKPAGAQAGAISGLVAGGLITVGQIIAAILAINMLTAMDVQPIIGTLPDTSDTAGMILVNATAGVTGLCFGIVGAALAGLAGAGTGYLSTRSPSSEMLPPEA